MHDLGETRRTVMQVGLYDLFDSGLRTLAEGALVETPPRLREAIRYALLSGGSRWRPTLLLHVALACGIEDLAPAMPAAYALEMLHAASLVHDDLPCFDGASLRRGLPSVHARYGESTAVLVGDALIVLAFETMAKTGGGDSILALARAAGPSRGLIAGQGWELEQSANLDDYHRAKTSALFVAATTLGARAAGAHPEDWYALGETIGLAFQAADDLRDLAPPERTGKSSHRDAALGRPSAVATLGIDGSRTRVRSFLGRARESIPRCPFPEQVHAWLEALTKGLVSP